MLPRLDINATTPGVGAGGAAPLGDDAPQQAFQQSLRSMVGQSMPAAVIGRLDDGSFLVNVANTTARMLLPAGAQVGTQLTLTLVSVDPRPTFQTNPDGRSGVAPTLLYPEAAPAAVISAAAAAAAASAGALGAKGGAPLAGQGQAGVGIDPDAGAINGAALKPQSLAAALLGRAPLTATGALPGFDPSAPAPTLSGTARAIASMLSQAGGPAGGLQPLHGKTPLVADGAPDPQQLAARLRGEVGDSGLFYESHVAEWADGKRGIPDLQREPQMQAWTQQQAGGPVANPALMVNQQLHTQEQARLAWQGQAWPGQDMAWDVTRDGAKGNGGGRGEANAGPAWRSGLRLRFPGLGAVTATLVLTDAGQLSIALQAGSADSAAALRAGAGALQQSMEAAGAPLAALSVGLDPGLVPQAGGADGG